jgi:hypothetical protein
MPAVQIYLNAAKRSLALHFKGHCEHQQGARQSLTNDEIATLPPTLRSGLRLTAMTWAYRWIRDLSEFPETRYPMPCAA